MRQPAHPRTQDDRPRKSSTEAAPATRDPRQATDPAELIYCPRCGYWNEPKEMRPRRSQRPERQALERYREDPAYWLDMALASRRSPAGSNWLNADFESAKARLQELGESRGFEIKWREKKHSAPGEPPAERKPAT